MSRNKSKKFPIKFYDISKTILGFVSGAVFLYMMASRLIPVINIWEQKELLLYNAEVQFHRAKVKVMGKPR